MEKWKPVVGYKGKYEISSYGRIRSLLKKEKRILKASPRTRGRYLAVSLCYNGKIRTMDVHRMVAQAFLKNPKRKTQINHLDGNKINPRLSNLEWCSPKENMQHAHGTGLMNVRRGELHHYSKLTNAKVIFIRSSGKTVKELAKKFKVSLKTIRRVKNKITWAHL